MFERALTPEERRVKSKAAYDAIPVSVRALPRYQPGDTAFNHLSLETIMETALFLRFEHPDLFLASLADDDNR